MTSFGLTAGELAQKCVEDKLKDLPSGYDVLTGIDILDRQSSELDVTVVTPSGMLITLEIKAGNLQADDSGMIYRQYDNGLKNISHQLSTQNNIVRRRLSELSSQPSYKHFLVLPHGEFTGRGIGISPERIIDASRINEIVSIIVSLETDAVHSGIHSNRQELLDFLNNRCKIQQSLASISKTLDARCREIAAGLATWVPRISCSIPVVSVEAPAGAGKTQLAVALLEKTIQSDQKAWYVTFNRNIAEKMQSIPCAHKVRFIGTWHELALEKTRRELPLSEPKIQWDEVFTELSDALITKLEETGPQVDLIVVDDAQDLKPEWTAALYSALSETGTMYLLSDPEILPYSDCGLPEFSDVVRVVSNESARVPQSVANYIQGLGLTRHEFQTTCPYEAKEPEFLVYTGKADLLRKTRDAIDHARKEGFQDDQIAILSFKARQKSEIISYSLGNANYRLKYREGFVNGKSRYTEGSLLAETIRRFKGLQASCVILTEVEFNSLGDYEKSLLYLGMTRASMSLRVVLSVEAYQALVSALS